MFIQCCCRCSGRQSNLPNCRWGWWIRWLLTATWAWNWVRFGARGDDGWRGDWRRVWSFTRFVVSWRCGSQNLVRWRGLRSLKRFLLLRGIRWMGARQFIVLPWFMGSYPHTCAGAAFGTPIPLLVLIQAILIKLSGCLEFPRCSFITAVGSNSGATKGLLIGWSMVRWSGCCCVVCA